MAIDWRVGMKVVCVRREPWISGFGCEILPEYGKTYTIRAIEVFPGHYRGIPVGESPHFMFEEIINRALDYSTGFRECAFLARNFRHVAIKEADISIFTAILDRINKRIPADA